VVLTALLFPEIAGVRVDHAWREGRTLHVAATTTGKRARCPCCGRRSRRLQSRYTRTIADLPCCGAVVTVHLRTRRFWCRVRWCHRKIFCERLPEFAAAWARRSIRVQQHLRQDAFALGGDPGAQHARAEGMPVSARTLLRLVRATPLPSTGSVRVLGVDDWARRRGRSYGTILVNLETHRAIDLLPDRTGATLAVWLRQHPEVEIISRDRGGAYADGARQGAPQALQIADRFHLRKNATDALERFLIRQHAILRQVAQSDDPVTAEPAPPTAGGEPGGEAHHAERRARYEAVVALRSRGSSIATIAARLGLSQRTVQRWLQAKQFPARRRRTEGPTPLTPFVPFLRERWMQGCQNARRLWQDLQQRGYTGGYGSVAACVRPWRGDRYRWRGRVQTRTRSSAADRALSPRQVCWLLLRPATTLGDDERAYLARLAAACPQVTLARALVEAFGAVFQEHDVAGLYAWLRQAGQSGIRELAAIAHSIWADRRAVEAAVRTEWSNGQVEGQVNRLKVLKRTMYGRATFDLLRLRVLHVVELSG
jgi:transposase